MLICDKRRPRTRGDTNIRPPQGGRIKTAPPASGPRLGRSLAWGGTPPGPPGLRPLARLRAPGPCCLGHPAGGFRARVRRWRGWATACGCPCPTPSPWRFSGFWRNSKRGPCRGTAGVRGRAPVIGRRWATRPRRWAARVQPLAAVPAVHGLGEVVHGRPGYRAHLFGRALEKTGVFWENPGKLYFRGCGSESALRVFNWKLIS